VSYRRKVKNDGNHHKARETVEYIFRDGFQHDPPLWWVRRTIELGLYFDKQPDDPQPKLLTRDEARRIAANIAKLPGLLCKP